jgi:glycosyltransferase involved in cell wall biosynthesis
MKHLIVSREYPPAPGGGIGTYVLHLSRLLAQRGEEVHVIGALWDGAEKPTEEVCGGRLVVHRVPFQDWRKTRGWSRPHPSIDSLVTRSLFESGFDALAFGWQASLLAERLVEDEGIEVIESQEFEAPLYFFQLRRALGLGPRRTPPCLVHLHSPMEMIVSNNEWDIFRPYFQLSKRCEDFAIRAADALLCPSRYLSRQAEAHYGLPRESVETIPLPLGEGDHLDRKADTWKRGTICFVGRLERRKGIIEWIDAAVCAGSEFSEARFEFVGAGTPGAEKEALLERIPLTLRSRFLFRGGQPRSAIPRILAQARLAVVPSRWENFPYSCQESMASGLPVIASSSGGMAEMVIDGRSGFIAQSSAAPDLANALRRALETSPEILAAMGANAAEDIRRLCDPREIVERQLRFRNRLAREGARASIELPRHGGAGTRSSSNEARGVALVVTGDGQDSRLASCLASISEQRLAPLAVVLACRHLARNPHDGDLQRELKALSPEILETTEIGSVAKNRAVEWMLESGLCPRGIAFIDVSELISPDLVATSEAVLTRACEVGVVSFWCWQPNRRRLWARLSPRLPQQWLINEASPMSVLRTEALLSVGKFRTTIAPGIENWDAVNAIIAGGWTAVTVPEPLGTLGQEAREVPGMPLDDRQRRSRSDLLTRFPEVSEQPGLRELISLAQSLAVQWREREAANWGAKRGIRARARTVRRILRRILASMRNVINKQ